MTKFTNWEWIDHDQKKLPRKYKPKILSQHHLRIKKLLLYKLLYKINLLLCKKLKVIFQKLWIWINHLEWYQTKWCKIKKIISVEIIKQCCYKNSLNNNKLLLNKINNKLNSFDLTIEILSWGIKNSRNRCSKMKMNQKTSLLILKKQNLKNPNLKNPNLKKPNLKNPNLNPNLKTPKIFQYKIKVH